MSELFIEMILVAMIVVPVIATALQPTRIASRSCSETPENLHPTA